MVEEPDLGDSAELDEAAGKIEVGFAGFELAGQVVVCDHDGVCTPFERFLEDIAREGGRGIGRAARCNERNCLFSFHLTRHLPSLRHA